MSNFKIRDMNGIKECESVKLVQVRKGLSDYIDGTKTIITKEDLEGVTEIRDYEFILKPISIVTLPNTITTIGRNAFANTQIERFIMPDSVTFGNVYICQGCTKLKEFVIGKGITKTGNGWIDGCTALEYVEIPDNVTSIAWYFFQRCSNLKTVKFGRGVVTIEACFNGCTSLKEIIVLAENPPRFNAQNLAQIPADCIFKVLPTSIEAYKSALNWCDRADYIVALTSEEEEQYATN